MNKVIGIDLGATNVRGACVTENEISEIKSKRIRSSGTEQEVLDDVFELADQLMSSEIAAIGMNGTNSATRGSGACAGRHP